MLIRGELSNAAVRGWENVGELVRARSRRKEIDLNMKELMYTSALWRSVVLRMSITGHCSSKKLWNDSAGVKTR